MLLINPATEETTAVTATPPEEIPSMVAAARKAQRGWAAFPLSERIAALRPLPKLFEENRKQLVEAITLDMGKPVKLSDAEVTRCIDAMNLFFDQSPEWLADEPRGDGFIRFEPLGTVLAITPWNFPLSIPMFSLIPSLICGNTVVWKPSEYGIRTALVFTNLFAALPALPDDCVCTVIGAKEHGKKLVDERFELISFTGSTATGKYIAERAARNLTRVQLELGGLDAAVVLQDVDAAKTAESIVRLSANNSGQVCCAVKRAFVEEPIYDEFLKRAAAASAQLKVGNPFDDVDMGPLAGEFQLEKCVEFLQDAVTRGAKVLSGGKKPGGKGYFFPHTVLAEVSSQSKLLQEEAFSPLLPIVKVKNAEEAVQLANDTRYGLSASVWTNDPKAGEEIASQLDGGVVGVNRHGVPPAGCPWGGAKESGIGRMRSPEGFRECCNLKYIAR
jgi:acyl-CoA reductase-like NAD-dependent aldehyde dehydrogenase